MKKRILSLLGVMVILASMLLLGACKPKKPSGDNNGNNNGSNNGIISLENVRNTTYKRYSWGDPTDTTRPDVKKKIDWIYEQTGVKEVSFTALKSAAFHPGMATAVIHKDVVVGVESGDTSDKLYGVAIDIGTTTVVCALIDMLTGKEFSNASMISV